MGSAILLFVAFLLCAGLVLLWQSRRLRLRAGLPAGKIVYSDTSRWQKQEKPLISRKYGLVGKPDYVVVVRKGRRKLTIPVEVKSRKSPDAPYDSHRLQLGTYCLLIEDLYKQRPPYGLLHYQDETLQIPYTNELRNGVLAAAEAIRRSRTASSVSRQHEDAERCYGCGYRHACGEELAV